MAEGRHSTARHEAPAIVAASGCAPPMPPRPAVRIHRPAKIAAVVLAAHLDERLVGALHDALRADIDPGAGGHLAVHHEPLAIELVEVLPGRPVRHEVGVGDQHARRVGVGAEHADRLAGLDQQRLVVLEPAQRRDDSVERLPVARRAADAAVDDELARALRDVGIEIVHQHAQRRLGEPALGAELRSARGADDAHVVDAGGDVHRLRLSLVIPDDRLSGRSGFQRLRGRSPPIPSWPGSSRPSTRSCCNGPFQFRH